MFNGDVILNEALEEIKGLVEIKLKQAAYIQDLLQKNKELQHELDMRDKLKGGDSSESTKPDTSHEQETN
ncbi:hypothetical protein [Lactobacillus mulieris]|jgi:hypothetical protein|uniref:Uncharacterized protein n=1 Tax=Lactobacillus mulieris TaxID=2508708 RepID=A0AAP3M3E1_9LACO|nr:hypothetical protein [Lactobacillus mulieris]DAU26662.1 MAG TPA: hypothetical protein [Caudoviricetes sp.]MCF1797229.1 hypothetical protein [Lactobacillus mulieris]MCZ3844356.1 hypothetical protein [Lactobacillus mulieris]MCZ3876018.1 hypothetical protein [Lactobacillus mulieris]MCZ3899455.1 hypothetical protein [Lactobacillus mulieris]